MAIWFDVQAEKDKANKVVLTTSEQALLCELLVALKQTRGELSGMRRIMLARAKKDGVEVQENAD